MSPTKRKTDTRAPLEWAILATSIMALAAVVVALIASGLRTKDGPPDLSVTIGAPVTVRSSVTYTVMTRNNGGETADNVEIEVKIGPVVRTLTLAAVARGDQEEGVVVFPAGTSGTPTAAVQSYSISER